MSDETFEVASVEPSPAVETTEFRVMHVGSVTFTLPSSSPELHLVEAEDNFRFLSIPIALPDAQAIALALEKVEGFRPTSHEFFADLLRSLQADVIATRLVDFRDGVYYAEVDVMSPRGSVTVPCRATDGIALALRQRVPAPILCAEHILAAQFA